MFVSAEGTSLREKSTSSLTKPPHPCHRLDASRFHHPCANYKGCMQNPGELRGATDDPLQISFWQVGNGRPAASRKFHVSWFLFLEDATRRRSNLTKQRRWCAVHTCQYVGSHSWETYQDNRECRWTQNEQTSHIIPPLLTIILPWGRFQKIVWSQVSSLRLEQRPFQWPERFDIPSNSSRRLCFEDIYIQNRCIPSPDADADLLEPPSGGTRVVRLCSYRSN